MPRVGFKLHPTIKHTGNVEMLIFDWDIYLESGATFVNIFIKYYYRNFEIFYSY